MRARTVVFSLALLLAGAIGGAMLAPPPADAVSREIIEIQQTVNQLLQNQQDMRTDMDTNFASLKTIVQQAVTNSANLSTTMGMLQKTVQDAQANMGANNNSTAQQMSGISDNMQDMQARVQKLAQQISDMQSSLQTISAKVANCGTAPAPANSSTPYSGAQDSPGTQGTSMNPSTIPTANPATSGATQPPSELQPISGDTLYSNALRDLNSGHYDLSGQEFTDYLRNFPEGAYASNSQFYIGEIAYAQGKYNDAIAAYDNVILNYPKSFKVAAAMLEKGRALAHLGKRTSAQREFRELVRRYPGTDEAKKASAEMQHLTH
jgi:tol-pal system protein YbgF